MALYLLYLLSSSYQERGCHSTSCLSCRQKEGARQSLYLLYFLFSFYIERGCRNERLFLLSVGLLLLFDKVCADARMKRLFETRVGVV